MIENKHLQNQNLRSQRLYQVPVRICIVPVADCLRTGQAGRGQARVYRWIKNTILQDLRNRKNASGAFKTLHTAWKSANERIGMPKHFTLNSPQHSAFNAAVAPFSEKLSTLQYKKDSHNEVLAVLKEGLETIAKKEIELFGS